MSLKQRLAWVIAALAFLPNFIVVTGFWLTNRGDFPLVVLVWILVLALVSGLVGYIIANALLRPVDELTRSLYYLRGAQRTLAELSLPYPKEPPPPEIQQLREGFDELLEHLRELLEAREATYAALTHDLKTPLIASLRALEYLQDADQIGADRRKEYLRQLQDELLRSYQLVENLLTSSRLENQRLQLENLSLRSILEDFRLRYEAPAQKRGIKLEIVGSGQARADRQFLERAAANLTENAIRHARSRVILRAGDGYLEFEDDGPGLPDSLENLTQPFRSQRLHGIRAGSAGLGLFVAHQVASAHGGKLDRVRGALGGTCLRLHIAQVTKVS